MLTKEKNIQMTRQGGVLHGHGYEEGMHEVWGWARSSIMLPAAKMYAKNCRCLEFWSDMHVRPASIHTWMHPLGGKLPTNFLPYSSGISKRFLILSRWKCCPQDSCTCSQQCRYSAYYAIMRTAKLMNTKLCILTALSTSNATIHN